MKLDKKRKLQQSRHWRIRKKVSGSSIRPRLSVHFSNKHIYAQCINDVEGVTLVALSSLAPAMKEQKLMANKMGADILGNAFVSEMIKKGIAEVAFDRGTRRYHGCVQVFADAIRRGGINF